MKTQKPGTTFSLSDKNLTSSDENAIYIYFFGLIVSVILILTNP